MMTAWDPLVSEASRWILFVTMWHLAQTTSLHEPLSVEVSVDGEPTL